MSQTVHVRDLRLVPLDDTEAAKVVHNEMRRRAWEKYCADWIAAHPGAGPTWFINDDAFGELATWEHS